MSPPLMVRMPICSVVFTPTTSALSCRVSLTTSESNPTAPPVTDKLFRNDARSTADIATRNRHVSVRTRHGFAIPVVFVAPRPIIAAGRNAPARRNHLCGPSMFPAVTGVRVPSNIELIKAARPKPRTKRQRFPDVEPLSTHFSLLRVRV